MGMKSVKLKSCILFVSLCQFSMVLFLLKAVNYHKQQSGGCNEWDEELQQFQGCSQETTVLGYLANNLKVQYKIIDNLERKNTRGQHSGQIKLTNTGNLTVKTDTWQIYFCSFRLFESHILNKISNSGARLGDSNILVYHINGCLHKLKPTAEFAGFYPNVPVILPFKASEWTISRSEVLPRWLVTLKGREACSIVSTDGESLDFVADFATPRQWKRTKADKFNPLTAEIRYKKTTQEQQHYDHGEPSNVVIPTPLTYTISSTKYIDMTSGNWMVVYSSTDILKEAYYLAEKLQIKVVVPVKSMPKSNYILVSIGRFKNETEENREAYKLQTRAKHAVIKITGISTVGVFYGIQTLLSLAASNRTAIPESVFLDYPRFSYRGLHLDVARNFLNKKDVMKIIDVMSMYKLNKFHFHLTDDEGWRLEIPGLEHATKIGSKRCFDLDEQSCILPLLGSAPLPDNTSFYTVNDYKEILQFAADRHVEVIPEFDMPGHSRAIIKAMEAKHKESNHKDMRDINDFLLSEPDDRSVYRTVQMYNDNVINPCIPSTYNYVNYLVEQVQLIHKDIQPLKVFHFGGEEVPKTTWLNSSKCEQFSSKQGLQNISENLNKYFSLQVADITYNKGLGVASWEDAFEYSGHIINREHISNKNVYVYAWNNIWETVGANSAYNYANEDYKVILSHATHLYFDHPHEPDPEERGLTWATRYIDTYKTFTYNPIHMFDNMDSTIMGEPLNKEKFCAINSCASLMESKRANIIGIQGQVWSELLRTPSHFDMMIYPRLLALAERAWHKSNWEQSLNKIEKNIDWEGFANTLGYKELRRLDMKGVKYHIPPPGAKFTSLSDGTYLLEANVQFPGLPILYSIDNQNTWTKYRTPVKVEFGTSVYLKTRSAHGNRFSRTVSLEAELSSTSNYISKSWTIVITLLFINHIYLALNL